MTVSEIISKIIGEKRQWRMYKARISNLPANYRMAVEAIERYLLHFGPWDGRSVTSLLDDLAGLFEQAAADGTPIREIVGADPVEFVNALIRNYPNNGYIERERERLVKAIDGLTAGAAIETSAAHGEQSGMGNPGT